MDQKEIDAIIDTSKYYFKDLGWSDDDIDTGMAWLSMVILVSFVNNIPLTTRKFPEVLRALANIIELMNAKK